MLASLLYIALRRLLELAVLACRSEEFKELEIVVLRHEVATARLRGPRFGPPTGRCCRREPASLAQALGFVVRYARRARALASPARGAALDLPTSAQGASADRR